jgi:hypothetical protein
MTLNNTLLKLIRTLPRIDVQNTLMTSSDRELALSLFYMDETDRRYVLSLLSSEKKRRVGEELFLHNRIYITRAQYERTIQAVINKLKLLRRGGDFKSYLRPKKYRSRRD